MTFRMFSFLFFSPEITNEFVSTEQGWNGRLAYRGTVPVGLCPTWPSQQVDKFNFWIFFAAELAGQPLID